MSEFPFRRACRAAVLACAVLTGCTGVPRTPPLQGVWVGNYAMFPAVFRFAGDTARITLAGRYFETRFHRVESAERVAVVCDSPAATYTFTFVTADSAVVALGPRERIAVARTP